MTAIFDTYLDVEFLSSLVSFVLPFISIGFLLGFLPWVVSFAVSKIAGFLKG